MNMMSRPYGGTCAMRGCQPKKYFIAASEVIELVLKMRKIRVNRGDMAGWPSSKRIGQTHAAYKVIIDEQSHHILGAHLLGHNAEEAINIFAMAMRFQLTNDDLKQMLWAYPTYVSDLST